MRSTASSSVAADQAAIHSSIAVSGVAWHIAQPSPWRPLLDIVVDWAVIWIVVCAACWMGGWTTLLAIFVIGNRQRALGNLLHEAGHQNLSAQRSVNDRIAYILLCPPLFNDLALYRQQHARHHAWLGNPVNDPDFILRVPHQGDRWFHVYLRVLTDPKTWAGSLFGHIPAKRLTAHQRLGILLWWGSFEALLAVGSGMHFALVFVSLWLIARGTVYHAITTFREMTDHYGLEPHGIFPYTRDIPDRAVVSLLLHPHHNGYHLTHHLFPRIPYYHLPDAHARLKWVPSFGRHAIICTTYLTGSHAAVDGWGARHG